MKNIKPLKNDAKNFKKNWKSLDQPSKMFTFVFLLSITVAILDAIAIHSTENTLSQIIIYIKDLFPLLFFALGQFFSSQNKKSKGSETLEDDKTNKQEIASNSTKDVPRRKRRKFDRFKS
ncbi:hypothetical protein H5S40_03005 [Limosilactobacillus sp. RRLNB_1_1]|uniref:Uncharacterized protein n=1 Tax=Limosilactobacillus albertensis TaxID=2759752 RepID=A0A7W3TQP0_9LACO|nr:hypothetical protein [Limosilactobacillus albertensis]MBB1069127.1 hypothetical protein [Limosilactobacillus albertensis]MCD7117440.1 hypothetical protein [Limosilactobacillus albertensis]MCD7127912.1 hypothetical protein [Limosilactobacillus albertensis]